MQYNGIYLCNSTLNIPRIYNQKENFLAGTVQYRRRHFYSGLLFVTLKTNRGPVPLYVPGVTQGPVGMFQAKRVLPFTEKVNECQILQHKIFVENKRERRKVNLNGFIAVKPTVVIFQDMTRIECPSFKSSAWISR